MSELSGGVLSESPPPPPRAAVSAALRAGGCVFADEEAALLLAAAKSSTELATLVDRRVAGEPLEHIVGWAEFRGLRIPVAPAVFVPRRRTEFLVEQAVAAARAGAVAVDLCCGSGAIAAALAQDVALGELHAADVDPAAVRCARANLVGVATVHEGDLFAALPDALRGRIDVLTANVPYVPTDAIALLPPEARLHEARIALDGGVDGLAVARRLIAEAPPWLAPGGCLLFESSEQQADAALTALIDAGLTGRLAQCDEWGTTVVIGRMPVR